MIKWDKKEGSKESGKGKKRRLWEEVNGCVGRRRKEPFGARRSWFPSVCRDDLCAFQPFGCVRVCGRGILP